MASAVLLSKVKDPTVPVSDKVTAIHKIDSKYGDGSKATAFIDAGGVIVLVEIAVSEWPSHGDLSSSTSIYDSLCKLPSTNGYHSMRALTMYTLSKLSQHKRYIREFLHCGFLNHFPKMLSDLCPRYHYGHSPSVSSGTGKGCSASRGQLGQLMVLQLVKVLEQAARMQSGLPFCTRCLPMIMQNFDTPAYNQSEATPPGQQGSLDPYLPTLIQWLENMLATSQKIGEDQVEQTMQEMLAADTLDKIRKIDHGALGPILKRQQALAEQLQCCWKRAVLLLIQPARQAITSARAQSEALRDEGNAAFAGGNITDAAELYTRSLEAYSGNGGSASNKALCMLKLRNMEAATDCASWAVTCDPDWGKAWARMAMVLSARSYHNYAARCFKTAVQLDPSLEKQRGSVLTGGPAGIPPLDKKKDSGLEVLLPRLEGLVKVAGKAASLHLNHSYAWTLSFATYDGSSGMVAGKEPVFIYSICQCSPVDRTVGFEISQGFPTAQVAVRFLLRTMVEQRVRPGFLFLAYRMAAMLPEFLEALNPLGINLHMGTKFEAKWSADGHNTDYHGMNDAPKEKYIRFMIDV